MNSTGGWDEGVPTSQMLFRKGCRPVYRELFQYNLESATDSFSKAVADK